MSFQVRVQPSGHSFQVEKGETVLDAAMRQGIDLPYGCRGGACGSCAGYLISGEIQYQDEPMALSDDMQQQKQALFCIAEPVTDLVIHIGEMDEALPKKLLRCRVEEKQQLSHDVIALRLKLAGDERLQYRAGQYVEFILQDERRRAFSIANAPHDDELIELHIRHVPGGFFTDYLFDEMPDKSMLRIEGPLGSFYLREHSTRPVIMMGGGTGFGPLKAMIEHMLHLGTEQSVHLFMGVRALRDLYMTDMVKNWQQSGIDLKFTPVLSDAQASDHWQGETGYVHQAVLRAYPDLSAFDIYMSGPPPMINAAVAEFEKHGADRQHMYSDAFTYSADATKAMQKA
jgi:CDP-4-dehydro-6-deoxyglucose reductase